MLNLQPPYLDINNLRIYTDDKDPDVFYYVNQKPRLCFTEEGKPALSVYAVVPESGVGKANDSILETGLSIDIDLSVSEMEEEAARAAISKNFKRTAKTLSPAPLHKGLVTFFMAQKEGAGDAKEWYVRSGFSPSMIGTNRASVAVRATGEDAKRLVAALSNNQIMAIINYDLEVVGITPVYKAHLKADMGLVYAHVNERTKHSYTFYNKDVEKIVDDLKETNALEIEIEESDPDIKAEAMKTMMNELKTQVVQQFFTKQEIMNSDSTEEKIAGGVGAFFKGLVQSIIPNYSYKKREVDQSLLKTFEINLNQKNAKTIPISPQGQLKEIIDSAGVDIKDCLSWVLLDDLEVKGETVTINLEANTFEGNFIKSVVTYCRVIDVATGQQIKEPETLAFDSTDVAEKKKLSKSFTSTRYRDKQYRYEYWSNIYLDSVPGFLPSPLVTKVVSDESNYININTSDYYKSFDIDLLLPDLSVFDRANMVLARVKVFSNEFGEKPVMSKDFIIDKEHTENKRLSIITERELDLHYKIDFTYVIPNAKDLTLSIEDSESIFLVPNPFEKRWHTELECLADWTEVDKVIVDTRFCDALQEAPVTNSFSFTDENPSATLNVACSLDTPAQKFEYYYRVYKKDGSKVEGGWIPVEDEKRVSIDVFDLRPERTIQVRLKNPDDFRKNDIGEVKVSFFPTKDAEAMVGLIVSADGFLEFKYPWEKGDSKVYYYKFTAKDRDRSVVCQCKKTAADSDQLLLEFVDE